MTGNEFTPEQQQRWDTWVAVSARRGAAADRLARLAVTALFTVLLVAVAVVIWRL